VSDGQKFWLANVRCDGDVGGEVEVDWQWHKFVEVEQVCVGDHWDVKKEHEFFGHRVVEV
jgi:hypothetical protein